MLTEVVPDVQGGHMYIRIDDFGEQIGSSSWAEKESQDTTLLTTGSIFRWALQVQRRIFLDFCQCHAWQRA